MTLRYILLPILSSFTFLANSQCLTANGNADTSMYNSASDCGVIVNYTIPTFSTSCSSFQRDTFYFTGSVQNYTIPAGVSQVTIETWGAQGGANWVNNTNFGGYNKADFPLASGTNLSLYVGGQAAGIAGGYNGGGNGDGAGQGGGGATDVRIGSATLNDRIITSGGGGGAGYWSNLHVVGGVGGGVNGGDGYRNTTADMGGLGATPTGPGANGTCISFNNPAMAGSFGIGGSPSGCGCEGYGGGGGYYGGAASGNCRGGGGGSGFVDVTGTNIATQDGVRTGNGMIVISYVIAQTITVTQIAGLANGATFPVGTTTNTFRAITDQDTLDYSFEVTVIDTITPVIPTLQTITLYADGTSCNASYTISDPAATDNCVINIVSDAPSTYPIGTTQVNWTVTDQSGNMAIASQNVIVMDTITPVIPTLQAITLYLDATSCNASYTISAPAATDNCAITITNDAPSSYPVGTTQVNWTVTDQSGNVAVAAQDVIVLDTIAPEFDGFSISYQMCNGDTISVGLPGATDNCSATVTQISGPTDGSVMSPGQYSLVFVATDPSNNTDTISYTVNVLENPTVTLDIQTPASVICVYHDPFTLTGADPVGGTYSGTGVSAGQFNPATAGVGNTTITYSYTNFQGCSATATEVLVVDDCLGIDENSLTTVELFPNPTSGKITIKTGNTGTLHIYDAQGKFVAKYELKTTELVLNLNYLTNGLYSIQFMDTEGKINVSKLVIQQ